MTAEEAYAALVTAAIWVVFILVAVGLTLGTAFVYRVIVERVAGVLAREPEDLSDQTWRSRQ